MMTTNEEAQREELEALIRAIWGPPAAEVPAPPIDPAVREWQNRALATAIRAYLSQYLKEL